MSKLRVLFLGGLILRRPDLSYVASVKQAPKSLFALVSSALCNERTGTTFQIFIAISFPSFPLGLRSSSCCFGELWFVHMISKNAPIITHEGAECSNAQISLKLLAITKLSGKFWYNVDNNLGAETWTHLFPHSQLYPIHYSEESFNFNHPLTKNHSARCKTTIRQLKENGRNAQFTIKEQSTHNILSSSSWLSFN